MLPSLWVPPAFKSRPCHYRTICGGPRWADVSIYLRGCTSRESRAGGSNWAASATSHGSVWPHPRSTGPRLSLSSGSTKDCVCATSCRVGARRNRAIPDAAVVGAGGGDARSGVTLQSRVEAADYPAPLPCSCRSRRPSTLDSISLSISPMSTWLLVMPYAQRKRSWSTTSSNGTSTICRRSAVRGR